MSGVCTMRHLLQLHAANQDSKAFAIFDDGTEWSYATAQAKAEAIASGLAQRGVKAGDPVIVWLPNGTEMIAAWLGIGWLAAQFVPLNLAWRGAILANAVNLIAAGVAIVHADLTSEIDSKAFRHVIVVGDDKVEHRFQDLLVAPGPVAFDPVHDWDTMQLTFTSGTTGASKAVIGTYAQAAAFLSPPDPAALGADARFLLVLPLFHAGGIASLYAILRSGGTVIVPRQFRTSDFWPLVRHRGVTSTTLVQQMAAFVLDMPFSLDDHAHSLRHVNIAPMGMAAYRFADRFKTDLWTSYGSTEIGAPIASPACPSLPGVTGRLRPLYEARIVDGHDQELPIGKVGELIMRADRPWTFTPGYFRNAEVPRGATAGFTQVIFSVRTQMAISILLIG